MKLVEGIYEIEKGYRAITIEKGTKVQILKRKSTYEGLRCRDCSHCKRGKYKFSQNQWWVSAYCEKKPKTVGGSDKFFYSTTETFHACEMFEPKKEDEQ